jgi:phospholipid transport system substrate-binding protein
MTTMASRTRAALGAAALVGLAFGARALASNDPKAVVESTANSVIAVLRDGNLQHEAKQSRIEEIVYANVDFDTLSRLVLARNWKRFDEKQRDEFMREFKRHLSVTYGKNIDDYRNETVAIVGERKESQGDATVLSRIVRGQGSAEFQVNYRLREKDGQWRIIDVIVEGVSMVANFRSQFQDIVSSGGPDKLLRLLHEKNERGESLVPQTPRPQDASRAQNSSQ